MDPADCTGKARLLPAFRGIHRHALRCVLNHGDFPPTTGQQEKLSFGRNVVLRQNADRIPIVLDAILDSACERGVEIAAFHDALACRREDQFAGWNRLDELLCGESSEQSAEVGWPNVAKRATATKHVEQARGRHTAGLPEDAEHL